MNFMKANLSPKLHLTGLLPYFYKVNKKSNAIEIVRKAMASSALKATVLSNNLLAYSILLYLDTKTESSFRTYLMSSFNLIIQKPTDFSKTEVII